jgi:23S rRNA (pseudouridine1915-N3)-methyltransferase
MAVHVTRIDLVVVGAPGKATQPLVDDFERRLTRYAKLHVHELRGEPLDRGDEAVLAAEGARMLTCLDGAARATSAGTRIVACDSGARSHSSEELVDVLLGAPHLVLLVGGAAGLAPEVLARADARISFGRQTLPHVLARIVLTEQLYRAFRIARGEPYHH